MIYRKCGKDWSIKEDAVCELLSLTSVHHLVSRISGEVRDGVTITDIFRALFPCGSITGAPKIAAMEVIAEVERSGRGLTVALSVISTIMGRQIFQLRLEL